MIKGQLEIKQTVYRTYQVSGGTGAGQEIKLYECNSKAEAQTIMGFIGRLRGYPYEADNLARWLRIVTT